MASDTPTPDTAPPAQPGARDRIIDALMSLAAEERWDAITLPMVASRAGVTLAEMRELFPSKGAILSGFARKIDRVVLEGTGADMMGEPTRERLLDVMLRRLDALAPYKRGLREIRRTLVRDPLSVAALNQVAVNSWRFMLAAADIDTEDELGALRIQGAVVVFQRALVAWFDDDDPGLSRTMAVLDRELARGERVMARAEDVMRLTAPLRGLCRSMSERRNRRRRSQTARPAATTLDEGDDYAPAI
jgi:AcrR family transcriptional regulator